jgi:hypothetical protein
MATLRHRPGTREVFRTAGSRRERMTACSPSPAASETGPPCAEGSLNQPVSDFRTPARPVTPRAQRDRDHALSRTERGPIGPDGGTDRVREAERFGYRASRPLREPCASAGGESGASRTAVCPTPRPLMPQRPEARRVGASTPVRRGRRADIADRLPPEEATETDPPAVQRPTRWSAWWPGAGSNRRPTAFQAVARTN